MRPCDTRSKTLASEGAKGWVQLFQHSTTCRPLVRVSPFLKRREFQVDDIFRTRRAFSSLRSSTFCSILPVDGKQTLVSGPVTV